MTTPTDKTLLAVYQQRFDEHETGMCRLQMEGYRRTIRAFAKWLGHEATLADLTTANVNQFIEEQKKAGYAPSTIRAFRAKLLTLWNFAFEEGWLEPPRKIRRVFLPLTTPVAITLLQVSNLINTALSWERWPRYPRQGFAMAAEMQGAGKSIPEIANALKATKFKRATGKLNWDELSIKHLLEEFVESRPKSYRPQRGTGIPANLFFGSLLASAWDSGLRLGDLLTFKRSYLNRLPSGGASFRIVMSKIKRMVDGYFNPQTLSLIDQLLATGDRSREVIWQWENKRYFYVWASTLFTECGVDMLKFKGIRRSAASAAENIKFGAGTDLLGHLSRSTTVQF